MSSFTTPPPKRRMVDAPPPAKLSCTCHASRCSVAWCNACSVCCAEHNSRKKLGKEKRARGRPKKEAARADRLPREARKSTRYTGLLTPVSMGKSSRTRSYTAVLEFLGFSEREVTQLSKHLPPRNMRRSKEFWALNPLDDAERFNQQLAVMRFYRSVLLRIAEDVCEDATAATESMETFAMWLRPDLADTGHQEVVRSCLRAIHNAKKGSTECRIVRATLCGTFTWRALKSICHDIPEAIIPEATHSRSSNDFSILLAGGQLEKKQFSRQRFDQSIANQTIEFILAYENVSYLSWGTKKVTLEGKKLDVPSILLKKPPAVLLTQYRKCFPVNSLSDSSFYRLCSVLTNGTVQPRASIDYVTGFLVNDTFEVLAAIVDRAAVEEATFLKRNFDVVQAWLKYGHASKATVVERSGCPRHDVSFGLSMPLAASSAADATDICAVSCDECVGMHRLFQRVLRVITASSIDSSAAAVVRDILQKVELFMGHRLRVVNQQREIAKMIQDAKDECVAEGSTTLAVVLIDFKMKAEPLYFRETTQDHFGKRGMSWHGVQVRTWEMVDGPNGPELTENVLYYDQLSRSDNKQDKGAVLSLLEATMMSLRRHLPHITRIIVQSDNASCYQNACVILMLPILGYSNGIRVVRYEHTETQDGKSPLDGHFGQAQRKVRRFVLQGNNCLTPTQYVVALAADSGLPNCSADLVEYDRLQVAQVLQYIAPMEAALSKLVGRANDVLYDVPADRDVFVQPSGVEKCPDFTMRVFMYSSIGEGITIFVSPRNRSCSRGDGRTARDLADIEDRVGFDTEADTIGRVVEVSTDEYDSINAPITSSDGIIEAEAESTAALPNAAGAITGVGITTTARLARRARKWRYAANALQSLNANQHETTQDEYQDRALMAFATRRLLSLKGSGEIGVVDAGNLPAEMKKMLAAMPNDRDDEGLPTLKRGWARRPPNGKMYGVKYIRRYADDVKAMFERGVVENGEKLGAGRMVEELRRRYPGHFDIPSESEVRAEISKLFAASRKRQLQSKNDDNPPSKRRATPVEYPEFIEGVVTANPTVMPSKVVPLFRLKFGEVDTFSDAPVRTKASSFKRKYAGQIAQSGQPSEDLADVGTLAASSSDTTGTS